MIRRSHGSRLVLTLLIVIVCGQCREPEQTWEPLPLGTVADFRSLWFVDPLNGWIVGGGFQIPGGLIGRTRDGGRSWRFTSGIAFTGPRISPFSIEAVHFFDAHRGLVAADSGMLFATADGGNNWSRVRGEARSMSDLFDLEFIDDQNGWAIGLGGVFRTMDGGKQWSSMPGDSQNGRVSGRAIHFLDARNGWLVGQFATLMRTNDGGLTWSSVKIPLGPDEKPQFFDVFFVDARNGWVVGEEATILKTRDGGRTWIRRETGVPGGHSAPRLERIRRGTTVDVIDAGDRNPGLTLSSVRFLDRKRGWVIGYFAGMGRSLILRTQDGGVTWSVDAEVAGEELRALFALDADHVWAIGDRVREGRQAIYRRVPSGTRPGTN